MATDLERIPPTNLVAGQVTDSVLITFEQGVEELIVLELTNQRTGQCRLVIVNENGNLLATVVQDGIGAKRITLQPLGQSIFFFVECGLGTARADVVELRTASAVLPPGAGGSSSDIDDLNTFTGRGTGESLPSYGSTIVINVNDPLDTAIEKLDAAHVRDTRVDSFIGRTPPETVPTYSSSFIVGVNDDLETAIGKLDAAGSGSGIPRDNYVIVKVKADFPAPAAGVITLAAGVTYEINGTVDLIADRLDASAGACIRGICGDVDKILTSNATSLISSTAGLDITSLALENSSGPIFDVDGGGTEPFLGKGLRIESSSAVGDIDNCTIVAFRDATITATSDGLTLDGTNGFVVINSILAQGNLGTFTFLTLPATSTFNGVTIHDLAIDVIATQTALDISPSATIVEEGVVFSSAFTGVGTALAGITKGDLSWLFRSNRGVLDSKVIGEIIISGNATETVIVSSGVFVPVNATFVSGILERFTRAGDILTFTGLQDVEVQILANLNVVGVGTADVTDEVRFLVNGTPAGVSGLAFVDNNRNQNLIPLHTFTISNGDTISLEVANLTNTNNLIVQDMLLTVSER